MNYKKGFTLIELLVVIAIIGILSSVVLASLNSARDKGADAAIRGNIGGIRAQAELFYDNNNTYGVLNTSGLFINDAPSRNAVAAADSANGGGTAPVGAVATTASSTGWAASAALKTNSAIWYCVDGQGYAGTTTTALGGTQSALATNGCQ